MEPKYQLRDGIYLVTGAVRGALLDTNSGKVYSINAQACRVISGEVEDPPFWESLSDLDLAETSESPRVFQWPDPIQDGRLKFVWFEVVTQACNERCIHCYAGSMPKKYRSPEQPQPGHQQKMSFQDWQKVINESYSLGCRSCQFIGGEPFLYRGENGESLLDLIRYAKLVGFSSIEVFTNGTLIDRERVRFLKEHDVRVAVSLYSDVPKVHDNVTRTPGSHAKTVEALNLLRDNGVKTRVETVIVKANQVSIQSTLAYRKKLGLIGKNPSPVWPTGRGSEEENQPDTAFLVRYGLRLAPDFEANVKQIAHYRSGNACLLGKAAITESGEVLPCIFSRQLKLGNYLQTGSLRGILEGQVCKEIWQTTKDRILVCKDCEYRYVCFDCRALAEAEAQGRADFASAPNPRCTYNPYMGAWGDGLWKLTPQGEPVYSMEKARSIRRERHYRNRPGELVTEEQQDE